jgi:uncharacterized protein YecE (DUF72 family)
MEASVVEWYLGTMGFSYDSWQGVFYPPGLTASKYLRHYSRFFNAVEVDSTFYGTPRRSTVRRWYALTPAGFRFALKTPRVVTHEKRLRAAQADMAQFIDTVGLLEDKLGVILIQLPPSFQADQLEQLAAFLDELPRSYPFAVEFRHLSWHNAATAELLAHTGVCWAATEYPQLPGDIHLTTDFIYIRWIGQHGRFQYHDHERLDMTPNLQDWHDRIGEHFEDLHTVYGFFNNDYAGFAPATLNRFRGMVGLPVENLRPPQQGRLF